MEPWIHVISAYISLNKSAKIHDKPYGQIDYLLFYNQYNKSKLMKLYQVGHHDRCLNGGIWY
jgi:hypothetical protein